jgi:hypothetical protein
MSEWYCNIDNEILGPIDSSTLKRWGETGQIGPSHGVSRSPNGPWSPASMVQGLTFLQAQGPSILEATTPAVPKPREYAYRMAQLAPTISASSPIEQGNEAAKYLQKVVSENAVNGWEFFRVDSFGVLVPPGCLAALFGGKPEYRSYYVATFRKVKAD